MKKLTVLSMIAAAFLFTACGDSATGAEAKAANEVTKTEAPAKCGEGKCGEGKCGGDKKSATEEAKEAVTDAAAKVKEAAAEKAKEAAEAVKETATTAVDKAKEAATATAAAATEAVAAVTGPDGKALYAKCAGCHGADGKTKAMGKANPVAGQSAADLESHLTEYKAGTRNAHGMGMLMKGQVGSMSDAEIKAVAAYIAGL